MHRYGNTRPLCRDVLVGIIRNGGLSSLYAGWIAVLCRNIPHSMIKVSRYFQHSIHVLIEVAETSRFFCHRTGSVCWIVCHAKDLIFSILVANFDPRFYLWLLFVIHCSFTHMKAWSKWCHLLAFNPTHFKLWVGACSCCFWTIIFSLTTMDVK